MAPEQLLGYDVDDALTSIPSVSFFTPYSQAKRLLKDVTSPLCAINTSTCNRSPLWLQTPRQEFRLP